MSSSRPGTLDAEPGASDGTYAAVVSMNSFWRYAVYTADGITTKSALYGLQPTAPVARSISGLFAAVLHAPPVALVCGDVSNAETIFLSITLASRIPAEFV